MGKYIMGMQIYYYMVCKRKLWYYSNSIQMESDNENVVLGKLLDERMKTTIHHKDLDKDVSYQYLIRLEAYKLIKHIVGEKEYEGFKMW